MKILGVDYGEKIIGLALSDELETVCAPLQALKVKSLADAVSKVQRIIRSHNAKTVIVGLPLGRKGEETQQSIQTRYFANALQATNGATVEFWNESYSTQTAIESGAKKGIKRKKSLDSESARIILQEYLDFKKDSKNRNGGIFPHESSLLMHSEV